MYRGLARAPDALTYTLAIMSEVVKARTQGRLLHYYHGIPDFSLSGNHKIRPMIISNDVVVLMSAYLDRILIVVADLNVVAIHQSPFFFSKR